MSAPAKAWRGKWLTPFAALQMIVAKRTTEDVASCVSNFSLVTRFALSHAETEPFTTARDSFSSAARDLDGWCVEGRITGQGRRRIGAWGELGPPESLDLCWTNKYSLDFEKDRYGTHDQVLLLREDIEAQLKTPSRRGRKPKLDWDRLKAAVEIQIGRLGFPAPDGPDGWRYQCDVEDFVEREMQLRNESAAESRIRDHVSLWLSELKEAGK